MVIGKLSKKKRSGDCAGDVGEDKLAVGSYDMIQQEPEPIKIIKSHVKVKEEKRTTVKLNDDQVTVKKPNKAGVKLKQTIFGGIDSFFAFFGLGTPTKSKSSEDRTK